MPTMLSPSARLLRSRARYWSIGIVLIIYALPLLVFKGFGAFDAFLKIEGVDGESTDEKHANWIEIDSFQWGMSRTAAAPGTVGKLEVSPFTVTKKIDKATPKLFLHCCMGDPIPSAMLELTRPEGPEEKPYLKIELSNCMISSYSLGGGSGQLPVDSFSLNFTKVTMTYIPYDAAGNPLPPVTASCDLSLPQQ
jgi:type VI secretion system secreted protein Hcp